MLPDLLRFQRNRGEIHAFSYCYLTDINDTFIHNFLKKRLASLLHFTKKSSTLHLASMFMLNPRDYVYCSFAPSSLDDYGGVVPDIVAVSAELHSDSPDSEGPQSVGID